jgi:hypothetical protein
MDPSNLEEYVEYSLLLNLYLNTKSIRGHEPESAYSTKKKSVKPGVNSS